jgi:hypothetical protein
MEQNEKSYEKIIVSGQDEIVDVLKKIHAAKADRLILTFAEDTDLLVSPITFKVILKECDSIDKSAVAQIIQNNSGVANARIAGMVTTNLPTQVEEDLWDVAEEEMKQRKKETEERLRSLHGKKSHNNDTKVEENIDEEIVNLEKSEQDIVQSETLPDAEIEIDLSPKKQLSSFEERISQALEKSKTEINKDKMVHQGNFVMAIDRDIDDMTPKQPKIAYSEIKPEKYTTEEKTETNDEPTLANKSFKTTNDFNLPQTEMTVPSQTLKPIEENGVQAFFGKTKDFLGNIFKPKADTTSNPGKAILFTVGKILLFVLLLGGIIAYFMYLMMPLAKVKLFIESKPIAIEKFYNGEPGSVFNQDLSTVSVKTEEVKKERADSGKATGVDYVGTRAEGMVIIKCSKASGSVTIPAGTIFSVNGLNFANSSDFSSSCPFTSANVGLMAQGVGEEYNLAAGSGVMSISGFDSTLWADISVSFVGGAKTQVKVVSQKDIDDVVNKLKEVTFAEATTKLKDIGKNEGWQVIDATIKNELDGDVKTDVPAGTQADMVNVTIKTKSNAEYFNKLDVEKTVNDQLAKAAKSQNLFEGLDATGEIGDLKGVQYNIAVDKLDAQKVTVKLTASGSAKPDVNVDEITFNLQGKSWDAGKSYLAGLKFVTKPTEVEFLPEWFPKFAWGFPKSQGRIIISVQEVQAEPTITPTPTPTPNQ